VQIFEQIKMDGWMDCSMSGSSASKFEELELSSSGTMLRDGQDDVTSTTALAGSFASNAAAADPLETGALVTDAAPTADAEVHS